jgi:hypothetical protein
MHGEQDDVSASGGFRRDPKSVLQLLVGLELALKPSLDSLVLPTCTVQLLQRAQGSYPRVISIDRTEPFHPLVLIISRCPNPSRFRLVKLRIPPLIPKRWIQN